MFRRSNEMADHLPSLSWRRIVPAEETLTRMRPLLPIFGITRIANVTGLDSVGIPVVMVNRPNARALAVSQGKGTSLAAAKVSGLMEAIESWHAEHIDLPLKRGSYEDLRYSNRLVDPAALPRPASSPYTPFMPLLWIEADDLIAGVTAWVPYELVHMDYRLPFPQGHGCFLASSNGLASGNHRLEAIIHGLCEVIERDARTLWSLRDEETQDETRLDLETVADPLCRRLLTRFACAGVEVGVWDMTSDLGIPSFYCRVVQGSEGPGQCIGPAYGSGTHLIREVALARALTEAAQCRLTYISGARDDLLREDYQRLLAPAEQARWLSRIRLGAPVRDFNALPTWGGRSLRGDLDALLDRLAAVGLAQALVVDLTRREFGIPVVRVIVPGLEGVQTSSGLLPGPRARRVLGR
ncbi:YcaO-like family protein [Oleisolibacter albus]|uniref:YcaO-like family protein n=1 Tax=Oleisolibacter albus TaxID=2171757 RepID=UPI001960253D|nr:YcaO-like family protein [Oleisolibacter albus]